MLNKHVLSHSFSSAFLGGPTPGYKHGRRVRGPNHLSLLSVCNHSTVPSVGGSRQLNEWWVRVPLSLGDQSGADRLNVSPLSAL